MNIEDATNEDNLKPLAAKVERNNTPRFLFFSNISKNTSSIFLQKSSIR